MKINLFGDKRIRIIDREQFVQRYISHLDLDAIYLGGNRWIQSPIIITKIINILNLKETDKLLEIGCSSGYQASVFSQYCQKVLTLDCDKKILKKANKVFNDLKIDNIKTKYVHKGKNWKIKEKFNYIVVSMAIEKVPSIWFDQLVEGGILLAPMVEADEYHILTLFHKKDGGIVRETLEQCLFVLMQDIVKDCKAKHKLDSQNRT